MKDLGLITDTEALELGNMAFRVRNGGHWDLYHSKNWKLHLFQDKGKTKRVMIVDENEPLDHIDNLWTKNNSLFWSSNDVFIPVPRFNYIEITDDLVIRHHSVVDLYKMLTENSQYGIFVWLEQNGFMGEGAVLF